MPAIITPHFRRRNAQRVYEAAQALTDTYYIGLGKNDQWADDDNASNYTIPTGSDAEVREALMNLIALKRVNLAGEFGGDIEGSDQNISYVIPLVKWTNGGIYKAWNPFDINCFYADSSSNPCYVIKDNSLFLCVVSPDITGSTNAPAVTTIGALGSDLGDGYIWVKLQDATSVSGHPFVTKSYYPIIPTTGSISTSAGKALRAIIVNAGSNISNTSPVSTSILGDGTTGAVSLTITDGSVSAVTIANAGSDYTFGSADLSGLTTLVPTQYVKPEIKIVCAPKNGFGYDNLNLLPTWFLGFTSTFDGDETGEFLIDAGTDYRQISLIKNPQFNSDSQGSNTTCLLKIKYTDGTIPTGSIIEVYSDSLGNTLLGKAFVDYSETVGSDKYIYVHQNYSNLIDLGNISSTVTPPVKIKIEGSSTLYSVVAVFEPEYDRGTGEVIFLENRGPIKRNSSQVESIKVIVQF